MDRMRTAARLGARCLVALAGLVLIQVLVRPGGSGSGLAAAVRPEPFAGRAGVVEPDARVSAR